MINSLPISRKLLFVDINKEISIDECFAYLKKIFPSSVIISTDKIKEKHSNYVNYSYNNINHLLGSSINFVILHVGFFTKNWPQIDVGLIWSGKSPTQVVKHSSKVITFFDFLYSKISPYSICIW